MENMQITTIKEALINAPNLLWSDSLFLPDTLTWELETKVVICDPDDVDYVIPANDDAIRAVKVVMGVLNNAVAEVYGCPVLDFITEEDKTSVKEDKEVEKKAVRKEDKNVEKNETKKEPVKESKPVKKEKAVKEEKIDLTKLTVTDLKKMAKDKNIEGYSKMKKEELISSLK